MSLRIAIGRCDCRPPYRNAVEEYACNTIQERLANWRCRLPGDIAAVPNELIENVNVEGCSVTLSTYNVGIDSRGTLVVCQAFVHTWSRPTYLSIGAVGRIYAEGLLLTKDGKVEAASDDLMWRFR